MLKKLRKTICLQYCTGVGPKWHFEEKKKCQKLLKITNTFAIFKNLNINIVYAWFDHPDINRPNNRISTLAYSKFCFVKTHILVKKNLKKHTPQKITGGQISCVYNLRITQTDNLWINKINIFFWKIKTFTVLITPLKLISDFSDKGWFYVR